ncbi:hypothetical protein D7W79_23035 [Corallococcus exercitus]|nr:hypothetical protein D7W79_23035 [Corallococcus exercitus]
MNPLSPGDLVDPSRWMSTLARQNPVIRLKELSIPGTHDSCSRLGFCKPISTTQYATLEQQLDAGIRFLDVRIKVDDAGGTKGLKVVHGMEDVGDYYGSQTGRLSFETVLTRIHGWMNQPEHRDECVIIKVVDCDTQDLNAERAGYDTHTRVHDIWKRVEAGSPGKKSLDFNTQHSTAEFLEMTLHQAKGRLLLWRVFKDPEVLQGTRKAFGLDLYALKNEARYDNNPYFDVHSPAPGGRAQWVSLRGQSLYTWKFKGPQQTLTYADKMNAVVHRLYDAWCGHTEGVSKRTEDSYCLNELNIAAIYQSSGDRQDVEVERYYPVTNATSIHPLMGELLEQMLAPQPTLPTLSHKGARGNGSVGIILFDWADDPTGALRDFEKTRHFNEPLYKKVIAFNFQPSKVFDRDSHGVDSIRYQFLDAAPHAELQYQNGHGWHRAPPPPSAGFEISTLTA